MVTRGRIEASRNGLGLVALVLLGACRGKHATTRDAGANDASVVAAASDVAPSDALAPSASAVPPPPSSPAEAAHVKRAKEACAKPSASTESALDRGYAFLADGRRTDAVRTLHDAVRPPEASPVGEEFIHDGLPDGYDGTAGPGGWLVVAGDGKEWSYLFRGSSLVRRVRGRAELLPGTDLLRAVDGSGMTLVRITTGDVVFRAMSTDAFASRPGAAATVHTRCDGGQELVVFSGASSSRTLATTLDPRNAVEPRATPGPDQLGWIDDDHLWIRGVQSSFVYDLSKGSADPPPKGASASEPDWGVVTPRVDAKRALAVAHYATAGAGGALSTVLVDWRERSVLRRTDVGPSGASEPATRLSDDGGRIAIRNGPCELLMFKTADLTMRRLGLPCAEKVTPTFRFWPREGTLLVEAPQTVSILDANSGESLASFSYSSHGRAQLVADGGTPNATLLVEDCSTQGGRPRQTQTKVGRDLKATKTERPGTCGADAGADKKAPETPLEKVASSVCTVDTVDGLLPREVCAALRSENKDGGAPPAKGAVRRRPKR